MRALELVGEIDEERRLTAALPEDAAPGPVRVIVLWSDDADQEAEAALTSDWLRASTSSLQQVWDNEEDAIYDNV